MKRFIGVLVVLGLLLCTVGAFAQDAAEGRGHSKVQASNNLYIVQMMDAPVVAYKGDVPGLRATQPKKGQKIDPFSSDVIAYASYLDGRHSAALAADGRKVYDYRYTFNGFAAELTPEQAETIKSAPGVLQVTKDELVTADTATTPTSLGLTAPGGLWEQLGGVGRAGEDIIIGLVDSGVWPEGLSMSDRTGLNGNSTKDGKLSYHQIPGWHGRCRPGELFTASDCNQKLIGATWYNAGWGGDAGIKDPVNGRPWEFNSPRDYNGHGSHTSSTAGGNAGVLLPGPYAVYGSINGIAPRARIAMYKALWSLEDGSQANGFTSDLVAAIDQAVADGVDVINYSISGTRTNFLDPVQVAYFNAASVGVFVSASAGNSGPTTATVAHPAPWLTTVAATNHPRTLEAKLTLGDGSEYTGASATLTGVGPAPLIDSIDAALPGADPTAVALCFSSTWTGGTAVLDPAKVAGKIVLCDRGTSDRVDKSRAVFEAGGVGMILVNVASGTLNADFHSVPSVHLAHTYRTALKTYAQTVGPTATIGKAGVTFNAAAPIIASFSSRGPLAAGGGDLLKPDVSAPGVDIFAAVAPPGNGGALFASYQGTSMAAPHVAGLAALLKQLHPTWSPMAIKSAMMTSTIDVLDGPNTNSTVIFRTGAGHINPNKAADPGLVYDSNSNDWLAFLCGTTTGVSPSVCSALNSLGYPFDASDMNVPSIAIGDLVASQTVKRRVTNVGGGKATYTASYTGMTGFTVVISPSSLTLNPGETKSFTVTFTRTTATLNSYGGGQLTWTDGTHNVRIPMVVRPIALVAPAAVSSNGPPISYQVKFGFAGPFSATARGLVPAATTAGTVSDDPGNSFTPGGPGTVAIPVTVPAGITYARFSLFDANVSPASDIDLVLYKGTTLVASTGGSTSNEEINVSNPPAGNDYVLYVHGYEVPGSADFTAFVWLLDSAAAGNMTVSAPAMATIGGLGTIDLTFSGLASGTKYLGSVAYGGATGLPTPTIVRVDVP